MVTAGQPGFLAAALQRCVDAGKQALGRRLFIAGGAVDLAGKKQPADGAGFKAAFERARVKVVVLDGIAGPQNMGVFHAGHGAHQVVLDVKRQAGRDAVGVDLVRGQAFGLQKNLVAGLVGKAVDLVFDAGAITRADAVDLAGEHGAAVKTRADDVVRALIGVGDPARHLLRVGNARAHEAEHRNAIALAARHAVTRLHGALGKVDAAPVQPWRRAGFQPALGQLEFFEPRTQRHRRRVAGPPCCVVVQAHMDFAVQKGAGRQHHSAASELDADLRDGADHPVAFNHQIINRLLEQPQVGLVFEHAANGGLVQNPVGLGPRGAHSRALARIENAELNAALVGGQRHGAAQGIDLLDQVALADAANRGVAAHLAQRFDVVAEQQGLATHASRSQCGLGAGMAAADDDHVKFLGIKHSFRLQ